MISTFSNFHTSQTKRLVGIFSLNMRFLWYFGEYYFFSYSCVRSRGFNILLLDLGVETGVICRLGGFVSSIAMVVVKVVFPMTSVGIVPLHLITRKT